MKKILITFVYFISILNANIHIENAKVAKKAYLAGDYKTAFSMYEVLIQNGIVEANYYLGNMYCFGEGVKQDYKKAFGFYQVASDKGMIQAKYNLALMYIKGNAVKEDYKKAFKLLKVI